MVMISKINIMIIVNNDHNLTFFLIQTQEYLDQNCGLRR